MGLDEFHLVTRWRVQGTRDEVIAIFSDIPDLSRWWPSVYLRITELQPGDESGVGAVYHMHTKGRLPYTLDWDLIVKELRFPDGSTLLASGDMEGQGVWTFVQKGGEVELTYDWNVKLRGWFKTLSFLMKPLFERNHKWAMAQGEQSLVRELARRRAASPLSS